MRRPAYSFGVDVSQQATARYERRGVKLINLPGKTRDYARILAQLFAEMDEHISRGIVEASTSLKEESLEELSLPKGTTGKLCLFLLPHGMQSVYRRFIFPLAEQAGFTPTTVDEIISPGDSIVAKVAALIDRSELLVVDASSPWTVSELGLIASRRVDNSAVLLITEHDANLPDDLGQIQRLVRPEPDKIGTEPFLAEIDRWFQQLAERLPPNPIEEARRLLQKREYRAAVIASSVALEEEFRKLFSTPTLQQQRPGTLRDFIGAASKQGVLTEAQIQESKKVTDLRNRLVHTGQGISEKEARSVVATVSNLLTQLRRRP